MHFWALVRELVANRCDLWAIAMEFVVLACRRVLAEVDLFVFDDGLAELRWGMIDCYRWGGNLNFLL